MKKILLVLMFLVLSVSVFAIPVAQDKYVNDFASVFTSAQVAELRTLFSEIDSSTTAEMVVLTVETVDSMDMSQYAQEVADSWKIGKADKDNGLLILYAKQENKIWVATGYGLEGILPDSKIGSILDQTFVPARAVNRTAEGIVLAAKEYANVINENADEVRSGDTGGSYDVDYFTVIFMIVWISIMISGILGGLRPKCKCGGRLEIVNVKRIVEKKKGWFGIEYSHVYSIVTYRCPKCGKEIKKKEKREYTRRGFIFVPVGGHSSSGFSGGGGFGGGGFGGGGAGR